MGACRKEMTLGGEAFYAYGSLVARGGGSRGFWEGEFPTNFLLGRGNGMHN